MLQYRFRGYWNSRELPSVPLDLYIPYQPRVRVATQPASILGEQQPEDPEWKAGGDDTLKIMKLKNAVDLVLGGRLAALSYSEYSVCRNIASNPGGFVVIINLIVASP